MVMGEYLVSRDIPFCGQFNCGRAGFDYAVD
jgi:hypothetical protein